MGGASDGYPAMTPRHLHPRRRDRSRDEGWIREFLRKGEAAVLTTVREGCPYPVPILFVYDPAREALYFHTGRRSRTLEVLGGDPPPAPDRVLKEAFEPARGEEDPPPDYNAAVTLFKMGRLLPAPEASEFGLEYASVVVFGRGAVVEDAAEAEGALKLLMEKYAPHMEAGRDYRPVEPEEVRRTAVFRVDILGWAGKEKREGPDFPGAYRLEDVTG